jgi:uncharacterized protein YdaU (DUF1376 family)
VSTHPYLPLYVDDYEAATAHLTVEEDGAYSRLIRLCWRTPGCSLPADEAWIARKIRMTADDFARVAKPVLDEFFCAARGRLVQKRLKREYEDISRKKTARKLAGKKGGEAKARKEQDNSPSIATVLPADTCAFPEPYPEPEIKKEAIASSAGSASLDPTVSEILDEEISEPTGKPEPWAKDPNFALAWKACTNKGRTRSSRAKAWPAWKAALKVAHGPALAEAVARYVASDEDAKRTGGPGFHIWLNDAKFEHWLVAGGSAPEIDRPRFSGPPELRDRVLALTDPEFVAGYIDPAGWDAATRALIARTGYGAKEIERRLRSYLAEKKITVIVAGQTAAAPLGVAA